MTKLFRKNFTNTVHGTYLPCKIQEETHRKKMAASYWNKSVFCISYLIFVCDCGSRREGLEEVIIPIRDVKTLRIFQFFTWIELLILKFQHRPSKEFLIKQCKTLSLYKIVGKVVSYIYAILLVHILFSFLDNFWLILTSVPSSGFIYIHISQNIVAE